MNELDRILGRTIICDDPFKPWVETEEEKLRRKILYLERKVQELERKEVKLPEKYIINSSAVILMWQDGSKTIVKKCKEDTFNARLGFLTAFFQHYTNLSKNKANKYLANLQVEVEKEPKQKPKHMKKEREFKIGDRVYVIFFGDENERELATITKIDNVKRKYYVSFDDKRYNNCWYTYKKLRLIKEGK